jgi:hypothetical protein
LIARELAPLARRAQPRSLSRRTASRTVGSSSSITGSRFVAWFAARRRELSESGYASGVVRCFSIRQPRIRISTASGSTAAKPRATDR